MNFQLKFGIWNGTRRIKASRFITMRVERKKIRDRDNSIAPRLFKTDSLSSSPTDSLAKSQMLQSPIHALPIVDVTSFELLKGAHESKSIDSTPMFTITLERGFLPRLVSSVA